MEKLGWLRRTAIVLSVLWVLVVYAIAPTDDRGKSLVAMAGIPLSIAWGLAWALQGYLKQRRANAGPKRNWKSAGLRALAGIVLFVAAYVTAYQLVSDRAAYLAGQWLAYGVLAYVALRFVPKVSENALIWTVVAFSGALVANSYLSFREESAAKQEVARASPLLLRALNGESISDAEIARADVGRFEPVLHAAASYARDGVAAMKAYNDTLTKLHTEELLTPALLGTVSGRKIALARLQAYDAAIGTLETSLNANAQRYDDQISVIAAQMPAQMGTGLKTGVAESRLATKPMIEGWIQSQRDAQQKAVELVRFVENLGPNVALTRDPPTLLFVNESDLNRYRTMLGELSAVAAREEGWREKMLGQQQQMGQKLVRFVEGGK
jgi:hypothetical protein